jgi:hypothetical protein
MLTGVKCEWKKAWPIFNIRKKKCAKNKTNPDLYSAWGKKCTQDCKTRTREVKEKSLTYEKKRMENDHMS